MRYYVWKAFKASQRRLHEGDPIKESDDISPHNFDDMMKLGFIGEGKKPEAPPKAAPKAAEKAPAVKPGEATPR